MINNFILDYKHLEANCRPLASAHAQYAAGITFPL
jgi:hypothetical protein